MDSAGVGWADVLGVVGALAVLGPLAYLTARLVGSRGSALRPGRAMRVVDALPLGSGRTLYLVEVGPRLLVVAGAGPHLERLDVIEDPPTVARILEAAARARSGGPFGWATGRWPVPGWLLPARPAGKEGRDSFGRHDE